MKLLSKVSLVIWILLARERTLLNLPERLNHPAHEAHKFGSLFKRATQFSHLQANQHGKSATDSVTLKNRTPYPTKLMTMAVIEALQHDASPQIQRGRALERKSQHTMKFYVVRPGSHSTSQSRIIALSPHQDNGVVHRRIRRTPAPSLQSPIRAESQERVPLTPAPYRTPSPFGSQQTKARAHTPHPLSRAAQIVSPVASPRVSLAAPSTFTQTASPEVVKRARTPSPQSAVELNMLKHGHAWTNAAQNVRLPDHAHINSPIEFIQNPRTPETPVRLLKSAPPNESRQLFRDSGFSEMAAPAKRLESKRSYVPVAQAVLAHLKSSLPPQTRIVHGEASLSTFIADVQHRARLDEQTLLIAGHYLQNSRVHAYLQMQSNASGRITSKKLNLRSEHTSEDQKAVVAKVLAHNMPLDLTHKDFALAAMVVAQKIHMDDSYSNHSWAEATRSVNAPHRTPAEAKAVLDRLNVAERTLYRLLSYDLHIPKARFEAIQADYQTRTSPH